VGCVEFPEPHGGIGAQLLKLGAVLSPRTRQLLAQLLRSGVPIARTLLSGRPSSLCGPRGLLGGGDLSLRLSRYPTDLLGSGA
jgi:hypothetical protein